MAIRAVFLTYAYPPLKYPRAIQVGRLARFSNHRLQVLRGDDGSPCDETIPAAALGCDVDVKTLRDPGGRWLKIARRLWLPDAQRPWALRTARLALQQGWVRQDDVLVTFGQPMSDHLAGLHLKRALGMPWIAHFSDPWADNPYHFPIPGVRSILRSMERHVVQGADQLLFTSQETLRLVMRKYPSQWGDRAKVLPHAFDAELYGASVPRREDDVRVIRYVGNFYRQRNPLAFADALLRLQREQPGLVNNVRFELIGRWVGNPRWKAESLGLREGLLTLRAPVAYLESLRLMKEADLLLIIDAPFEHSVFFPSKLVDYVGADRPIVAFTPPGTCADIVRQLGCTVYPTGDAGTLYPGLKSTLEALQQGRLRTPDPTVAGVYSAVNVARFFDGMIDDLAGGSARGHPI